MRLAEQLLQLGRDLAALGPQQLAIDQHAAMLHAHAAPAPAAARSPRRASSSAGTLSSCGHSSWCRHSVTSASSAAYSAALSTGTWLNVSCFAPLPAMSSYLIVRMPR